MIFDVLITQTFASDALDGTFVEVNGNLVPGTFVDELGQIDLTHHGWHHMTVL